MRGAVHDIVIEVSPEMKKIPYKSLGFVKVPHFNRRPKSLNDSGVAVGEPPKLHG